MPLLVDKAVVNIIIDSWKFMQESKRLIIYAFVLMDTHLHFIAEGTNLSKQIANFKSYTARTIIDHFHETNASHILKKLSSYKRQGRSDRMYQFWQEESHPEMIVGHDMMHQKTDYIHYNPVRKELVKKPEDWKYSSASNYILGKGLLEVQTEW